MKKRVVSLLLCLIMALSLIPTTAFAVGTSSQDDGISLTSIVQPDDQSYYTYEFYLSRDSREPYSTQIVKEDDELYRPETPVTPEGKVFTGWYDEAGKLFTGFGKVDTIAESQTIKLYAGIEDGYYVFFMNGDTVIATETGTTGTEISLNSVSFPVNADQAITGWYTDKELNTLASDPVTIETSNISLYAKVEKGHWITFDSDGGSYVEPKFFKTGANTEAPNDPAKLGYAFAGWYNGNTEYTFGSALTESITLKAMWTAKDSVPYTVIHWQENANDTGYSLKETETKTGKVDAQTNAAAKDTKRVEAYNGFTAQTIVQKPIAGDGSTIVNVYYKRNEYVINFYSSNNPSYSCGKKEHEHRWKCYNWKGQLTCGKEEHRHTNDCLKPKHQITAKYGAYIRDQWPGGGWYVSPNGSTAQTSIDVMPLGGTNFYGEQDGYYTQTAKYYTEVLPGDEASGTRMSDGRYYKLKYTDTTKYDSGLTVTDEDRYPITGFTCNKSLSTRNGQSYDGAKFYYTRNSHDIVFISGSQKVNTVSKKYEESIADVNYKPTTPPAGKEGYTFVGWYDNDLCEGEKYVFTGKTMPAQNITLYAKWVAPVHTVTLYKTDKTTVYYKFENVPHNNTIDMTQIPTYDVPEGYKFLGWVLLADGTPFNFNTQITRNYELYAKIGSMATYTVTYDANDGSGTMADNTKYAEGAIASVKANSFTAPKGQVFLGWSTTANGPVEYYANSQLKIEKQNVTLYAIWGGKDSTVTLTYKANYEGADPAMSEVPSLKNNALVKLTAATLFTRTGYEFTGWNTKADGSGTSFAAGSNARVDKLGENVLYAQWVRQTGTLTITKKVEGLTGTSAPTEFKFTVTGPNNYSKDVTVSANGSLPLTGLPVGEYTVKEKPTDIPGYTLNTTYKTDVATAEPTTEKATVTVTANTDATVTVTNTYTKDTTSVTVTKEWNDNLVKALRPESVTVQLMKNGVVDGDSVVLDATNQWSYTWTDLSMYTATGSKITYSVKEVNVPAGYTSKTLDVSTDNEPNNFVITNTANVVEAPEIVRASLTVIKKDADNGALLKGAKFTLIPEGGKAPDAAFAETDENGKAVFTDLAKGTYTLKEITAPAGYQATDKTWTITVSDDAKTAAYKLVNGKFVKTITCKVDDVENVVSNGTITITNAKNTGTLTINKVLNVALPKDMTFKFNVMKGTGEPVSATITIEAGKTSGTAIVENLTVGTTYTVQEVAESAQLDGYTVAIPKAQTVKISGVATKDTVSFTNTYTKTVTPAPEKYTFTIDITKNIELLKRTSRNPGKASFTFEAYMVDKQKNVTVLGDVTIETRGTKSASGKLTFTLTDEQLTDGATVYVREVEGNARGWTYDGAIYKLEIGHDGKIVTGDTGLTFTNVYYRKASSNTPTDDKTVKSVKTGDMGIAMYAMTSLLSLGGAALVIKKRKDEK